MRVALTPTVLAAILGEEWKEAAHTLTDRERHVLEFRCQGETMEEVGRRFWVVKERIRQVENKALRKLCHPSRHLPDVRQRYHRFLSLQAKERHPPFDDCS